MIEFSGFLGQYYQKLHAENAELAVNEGRDSHERMTPTADSWQQFWTAVDQLGAWSWRDNYDPGVKDGGPWHLELKHGESSLATRGNGAEEYCPPGFRKLSLALHRLANRTLLTPRDERRLGCDFELCVMIAGAENIAWAGRDEHPAKLALDAALGGAELTGYRFRDDLIGWTWIAGDAEALRRAVRTVFGSDRTQLSEAQLRDFATQQVEAL